MLLLGAAPFVLLLLVLVVVVAAPLLLLLLLLRSSLRLRLSVLLRGLLGVLGDVLMLAGSPRGRMITCLGPPDPDEDLPPLVVAGGLGGTVVSSIIMDHLWL